MDPIGVAGLILTILFGIVGIAIAVVQNANKEKEKNKVFSESRKEIKKNRLAIYTDILDLLRGRHINKGNIEIREDLRLLAGQDWIPEHPIPIQSMQISMVSSPAPSIVLNTKFLPKNEGKKYNTYSSAIENLDKPVKFEDREQYRLLSIHKDGLVFSKQPFSYFGKVDFGEYLMYQVFLSGHKKLRKIKKTDWFSHFSGLQQPSDYVVMCGINTLTLIHDGKSLRYLMHLRSANTGTSMGTYHVIPAGEFQPSCKAPGSYLDDFDLWKSISREYSEELLLMAEYDGNNTIPFTYDREPFHTFSEEILLSNIKPYYLGIGLDPITLQAEILAAVVFRETTFNKIFKEIYHHNDEGDIVTEEKRWGSPFIENNVLSYQERNILPAGYAALTLAWKHRDLLAGCFD